MNNIRILANTIIGNGASGTVGIRWDNAGFRYNSTTTANNFVDVATTVINPV